MPTVVLLPGQSWNQGRTLREYVDIHWSIMEEFYIFGYNSCSYLDCIDVNQGGRRAPGTFAQEMNQIGKQLAVQNTTLVELTKILAGLYLHRAIIAHRWGFMTPEDIYLCKAITIPMLSN